MLLGLEQPVQIAPMTASASDLVMLAVLAAATPTPGRSASGAAVATSPLSHEGRGALDPLYRTNRVGFPQCRDD